MPGGGNGSNPAGGGNTPGGGNISGGGGTPGGGGTSPDNEGNYYDFWKEIADQYGDDIAEQFKAFGDDGENIIRQYGDDAVDIVRGLPDDEVKEAIELINQYGDDAVRLFKQGEKAAQIRVELESGSKTPSEIARSWQGTGKYPGIDDYVDVIVEKGTVLYRGEPNGTGYFTTLDAIEQSGRDATKLFEGLQVYKDPIYGYRGKMQGYIFNEDVASAYGITSANPQFGKGGLPQYYVPDVQDLIDKGILTPVDSIKLNK